VNERTRRVGRNEVMFRQVNEEIETLERGFAAIADERVHLVCECGDLICQERVPVPLREYERIREDGALFFVIPGHEQPATEDVVERHQGFWIVRKRPGGPAELARANDPRG
jgi:hypothetical protein